MGKYFGIGLLAGSLIVIVIYGVARCFDDIAIQFAILLAAMLISGAIIARG